MTDHDPVTVARLIQTAADLRAGNVRGIPSTATSSKFGMELLMQARPERNLGQVYLETIAANNPGVDVEAAFDAICDGDVGLNDDGTLNYDPDTIPSLYRSAIIAMSPAKFRQWCGGRHRSTYMKERQWRTNDRNARKLAAKAAGEPWTGNDPRVDDVG